MLQGCPNGARRSGVARTPAQIAAAAAEMVAAGVTELHVHPKDSRGADTLDQAVVTEVVAAVREAVPGIPIGVTTGAWAEPDPLLRVQMILAWAGPLAPDYASVNWHEHGALRVATTLLEVGIGVEAGLYSGTHGGEVLARSGLADSMHRILAEVVETDPTRALAVAAAHFARVQPLAEATGRPVLLHGEEGSAWPVLRLARGLPTDQRIGLEDVLVDPQGQPADNAALVRSARDLLRGGSSR
jgi:uncharacterized protein (DUF849 family)